MNKEFIPYEQALELKELGFDEPCLAWYNTKGVLLSDITICYDNSDFLYSLDDMDDGSQCIAPTFSQAFRWFREKYHLIGGIEYIGGEKPETTWWDIYVVSHFNIDSKKMTMKYQPYEQAELACLKKLIEIVKQPKKN